MGPGQGTAMAVLVAEIYLDAREVLNELTMVQADIARTKVLNDIDGAYIEPGPQMMESVIPLLHCHHNPL